MAQAMNYYLLLGLFDFDNDYVGSADDDPAVKSAIAKALKDKQREWSADSRNPRKASKAGHNLDLSKHAEENLDTMDKRRAAWSDAKTKVEKTIHQQISVFALKGYLLSGELQVIAQAVEKSLGITVKPDTIKTLLPKGMEVREQEAAQGKELKKPSGYSAFHGAEAMLGTYGYASLYDLLGGKRGINKRSSTPSGQWAKWADEDKKSLPNKATTEVADHKKLYELCARTFANDKKRAQYDDYLAYEAMSHVLDQVKQACSVSKKLDTSVGKQYIDQLYEAGSKAGVQITREDASQYLLSCCSKAGIAYAAPDETTVNASPMELCPWCRSLVNKGVTACPDCGGKIMVDCPKCHTANRADSKFCSKCSYDYGNLKQASSLCDEAKVSAAALRFEEAGQLLSQAQGLWPGLEQIAEISAQCQKNKQLIGPIAEKLNNAVKSNRLCEAQQLYADVQRRSPRFSNPALKEQIESGIAAAKALLQQGQNIQNALRAYEACADYPGLASILSANPPKPVAEVIAHTDGAAHRNVITWSPSPTSNATYVLIRKRDGRPLDIADGEELVRTAATSFSDTNVESAQEYCYAVAVVMGPLTSTLTASATVINLFDVSNVSVTASEGSLQVTWSGLPRSAKVEAWRSTGTAPTKPGQGDKVANVVDTGLLDQGLNNGVEYFYTIFASYRTQSGTRYSHGVSCSGIPSAPPEPVGFMLPQLQPNGTFTLEWDQPDEGEVRFYYTTEQPDVSSEDTMSVRDLESRFMPLQVNRTASDRGAFTLPDDSIYHLIAATIKNDVALIGAMTSVSSKKAVEISKIVATGANASVLFDWPDKCERVLLAWRDDRYPASAEEQGASRKLVNKKIYDLNKAIIVEGLSIGKTYYFSLFTQLGSGDSASYSAGSNKTFSFGKAGKVTYRVNAKKFLGKITSATLILESTTDVQACELRVQKSKVPVLRTQGVDVVSVPTQPGQGVHQIDIPTAALSKSLYYKLFFKDKADYDRVDLILAPGTLPEIGK